MAEASNKRKCKTGGRINKRKRKKISKHALQSKKSKDQDGQTKKKKKQKSLKVKDPEEAALYLTQWKEQKSKSSGTADTSSSWKFNKNTQSWLIRHMYEVDKVSKSTFVLLLEYLQGMQGTGRTRIREEATRRALRYKDYEKSQDNENKDKSESRQDKDENHDKKEAGRGDVKNKNTNDDGDRDVQEEDEDEDDEEDRWNKLSDHEKRKEYKRARKILETVNSD